ncbi:hypothetical protein BJV74DRAFT_799116 [Russula compacta]|nr:hypothetical protein BJV74DRAFT_799116 [Russula compacta]
MSSLLPCVSFVTCAFVSNRGAGRLRHNALAIWPRRMSAAGIENEGCRSKGLVSTRPYVRLLSTSQTRNHTPLRLVPCPVALKSVMIARGGWPRDPNTAAANVIRTSMWGSRPLLFHSNPIELSDQRMPPIYRLLVR